MVHQRVRRCAGAALEAVHHDHVGACLAGQLDVVGHAAGADLDVDRDRPIGGLAQLLDLDLEVVRPHEVGVPAGRALVDAGRQRARLGDDRRHLRAQQHAAGARLRALADHDLGRVGHPQVVRVEAVAAGQHLVDQLVGGLALEVEHAAVAGGCRDADAGGGDAQRLLGVARERPVAHAGDRDRRGQPDRLGAVAGADLDARVAGLAVALQRHPRKRAGHERQVLEVRGAAGGAEAAIGVAAQLGLGLDVVDRLRRPHPQLLVHVPVLAARDEVAHSAALQASYSCFEKFHSLRPDTSFFQS